MYLVTKDIVKDLTIQIENNIFLKVNHLNMLNIYILMLLKYVSDKHCSRYFEQLIFSFINEHFL